jgi:glyoxylase-like metal-dependent hydrolase (beta-lactamase superfamily II)
VYAWLEEPHGIGRPNAGVVVDEDGLTVVDTLMVPSQSVRLAAAVAELGRPVPRVVLTSGHIEFAGGTSQFPLAAVFGSRLTSAQLDQPPNTEAYQAFMPSFAEEFEGLQTRPVSHLVDEPVMLTPAVEVIPVTGHTPGNLLVRVPAAGVLFAGGMCSFGVTPLAFQGDPRQWADTLRAVADLAETIVPGHGPVGGRAEVEDLRAYLLACADAAGDPSAIPPGPWDRWRDRHLDAINVERAHLLAQGEDRIPSSMLRAIGSA